MGMEDFCLVPNQILRLMHLPLMESYQNQYEIIIDNIIPDKKIGSDGVFVVASKTIGRADRSKCQPNFIHVAMRKKGLQHNNDAEYDYIDPSTYLDKLIPVPQWIEACNDHTFEYIGQTSDVDAADEEGAKESSDPIKRDGSASDKMAEFERMDPSKEPAFRPQGMESTTSVGSGFKNDLSNSLGSFGDVKNMFTGNLTQKLDAVVETLAEILKKAPVEHPDGMSIPNLRRLVGHCPTFLDALAKGFSHVFTAHHDCLGITSGISIPFGSVDKIVKVDTRVDKCNNRVHISSNGIDEFIQLDAEITYDFYDCLFVTSSK
ncbi:hypothetical protein KUTeg_009919 [Tegillarca granosa]|uniref:Uncharacterized protein n=1 Tax=Tegillarca granosa TaxID=220873 RepID=A0ABQ9F599_TEGGR|nr:hypothetical protein KUTeg_009919 [Tegillarca granosa]